MVVLAHVDIYQIGTLASLVTTAFTGFVVFVAQARVRQNTSRSTAAARSAELVRSEVEGWQTLISSLTEQYERSKQEVDALSKRLAEEHETAMRLQEEAASRISALEDEIQGLKRRLVALTSRTHTLENGTNGTNGTDGPHRD